MIWPMVISGIALCTIGIKSFLDRKKGNADTDRHGRRRSIAVDALSFLVGIGGILIGSGVFLQYIMLNKVMMWVIILCQFIVLIATKLRR